MNNYFVAFGRKYAYEPHPTLPGAHPDGLLKVVAADEADARRLVFDTIGNFWAFLYEEKRLASSMNYYPAGVTHILDSDGIRAE